MNTFIEKIYFRSPIFFQNIMVSVYGYKLYCERYVGNHDYYLEQLLRSQWYDETQIRQLIERNFISIFRHAIKQVPFYRELLETGKINSYDINGISDMGKLPIISKEQIRENPEHFLAAGFGKRELIKIFTSGTTGKSLKIFVDKNSRRHAYAFLSRLKIWAGIDNTLKNVTFAGRTIAHQDDDIPPFWRKNIIMNNYLFSSYHISPKNIKYYIEELKNIQPHFIDSYPSSIYAIAKYMQDTGVRGIYPKAIITSSETLFDYQRKTIEEIFNCPIFDQYGCAEQVVFVSQCEKGSYHIHPEFGIVEFLREDGSSAKPGEQARLVCTGFTNRAMPLIRYDIGDSGVLSDKKCLCNRHFPVIEHIIGRTDDVIKTRDGRWVGRLDPVFKSLQSIEEAQIIQEDYDKIILRIVPGANFKKEDAGSIVKEMNKRLGSQAEVKVEIMQEIPRSAGGKFRAVISKVKKDK